MGNQKKLSGWDKLWAFAKPVIVVVLAVAGYLSSNQTGPQYLFVAIIGVSFLLRGKSIIQGFAAVIAYLLGKKKN